MSYLRYQHYKDSGIEWLGEMPSHWVATPIKHLGRLKGGSGFPHDEQGTEGEELQFHKVNALGKADSGGLLIDGDNTISVETAKRLGAHIFPEKSLVFAKVGAALFLARICQLAAPACIDNNMMGLIVHQKNFDPSFVKFAMSLVNFDLIANPGAVPSLNEGQIGNFKLGIPSLLEQTLIASFLGRETAKIDELAKAFDGLVGLLKEKRQAVISHAVTKGLDPSVPMKDSGIEWLGQVPAHWDVFPMKRALKFLTSGSRGWADHYADEGALFIRIGNLTRNDITLDLSDIQRVEVPMGSEGQRTSVLPGDVLFSITAYLGSVAVVPDGLETAYVSQHVALTRIDKKRLLPNWTAFVAKSVIGKTYLETQGYGGTKIQLSLDDVANMPMTVPPLAEQQSIVEFVLCETAKLDALTIEAKSAIQILQERRKALISAAVTGKIDVRGLVNVVEEEKLQETA